jgi:hypothetical protein
MNRILCSLLVAILPFGGVLAVCVVDTDDTRLTIPIRN